MSTPSDTDIAWLAGLLEGEGSFMIWERRSRRGTRTRPRIALAVKMTDRDVVERAAGLMGSKHAKPQRDPRPNNSMCFKTSLSGAKAERVMRLVRPHMGARRGAKIDEILAAPVGTYSHQPRIKEET